jgi:hypothetical protein
MWHKNLRIAAGCDRNAVAQRDGGSGACDVANHNSTCDVQENFCCDGTLLPKPSPLLHKGLADNFGLLNRASERTATA